MVKGLKVKCRVGSHLSGLDSSGLNMEVEEANPLQAGPEMVLVWTF